MSGIRNRRNSVPAGSANAVYERSLREAPQVRGEYARPQASDVRERFTQILSDCMNLIIYNKYGPRGHSSIRASSTGDTIQVSDGMYVMNFDTGETMQKAVDALNAMLVKFAGGSERLTPTGRLREAWGVPAGSANAVYERSIMERAPQVRDEYKTPQGTEVRKSICRTLADYMNLIIYEKYGTRGRGSVAASANGESVQLSDGAFMMNFHPDGVMSSMAEALRLMLAEFTGSSERFTPTGRLREGRGAIRETREEAAAAVRDYQGMRARNADLPAVTLGEGAGGGFDLHVRYGDGNGGKAVVHCESAEVVQAELDQIVDDYAHAEGPGSRTVMERVDESVTTEHGFKADSLEGIMNSLEYAARDISFVRRLALDCVGVETHKLSETDMALDFRFKADGGHEIVKFLLTLAAYGPDGSRADTPLPEDVEGVELAVECRVHQSAEGWHSVSAAEAESVLDMIEDGVREHAEENGLLEEGAEGPRMIAAGGRMIHGELPDSLLPELAERIGTPEFRGSLAGNCVHVSTRWPSDVYLVATLSFEPFKGDMADERISINYGFMGGFFKTDADFQEAARDFPAMVSTVVDCGIEMDLDSGLYMMDAEYVLGNVESHVARTIGHVTANDGAGYDDRGSLAGASDRMVSEGRTARILNEGRALAAGTYSGLGAIESAIVSEIMHELGSHLHSRPGLRFQRAASDSVNEIEIWIDDAMRRNFFVYLPSEAGTTLKSGKVKLTQEDADYLKSDFIPKKVSEILKVASRMLASGSGSRILNEDAGPGGGLTEGDWPPHELNAALADEVIRELWSKWDDNEDTAFRLGRDDQIVGYLNIPGGASETFDIVCPGNVGTVSQDGTGWRRLTREEAADLVDVWVVNKAARIARDTYALKKRAA